MYLNTIVRSQCGNTHKPMTTANDNTPNRPLKIVVTGAAGMLGSTIFNRLSKTDHWTIGFDSKSLDITNSDRLWSQLTTLSPVDMVINCAAFTDVDLAESKPETADQVNGHAVGTIAKFCSENSITLVHFSTDYVFDGSNQSPYSETDIPTPINVYGKSKLTGELAVQLCPRHYIFRLQWLYGDGGRHFLNTIYQLAKFKPEIPVVADQWGAPTWTRDVANWLIEFLSHSPQPPYGTYHLAPSGWTNWATIAKMAMSQWGLPTQIVDCESSEFARPAPRPKNSRLQTEKIAPYVTLTPWEVGLTEFLSTIKNELEIQ